MNTAFARRQMVRQQVRTSDVFDPAVLHVLSHLERDRFVPEKFADLAYADVEIPLGHDERMLAPIIEGRLLQALAVKSHERVLQIGTGSGFLTGCFARLGAHVTSLELYADVHERAAKNLKRAGIDNVDLQQMDAMSELPDDTFDVVAVIGSTPELESRFVERLAAGGRLFTVIGDAPIMQARLVQTGSDPAETTSTVLFELLLAPLVGAQRDTSFSF